MICRIGTLGNKKNKKTEINFDVRLAGMYDRDDVGSKRYDGGNNAPERIDIIKLSGGR
jgi:hypothetical protein